MVALRNQVDESSSQNGLRCPLQVDFIVVPEHHEGIGFLVEATIAPDLIRAYLRGDKLTRDQPVDWRFPGVAK